MTELKYFTIEAIQKELDVEKTNKSLIKIELLKHYLLNFILYSNLSEEQKDDSPIKIHLLKISILLEKLISMEGKMGNVDPKRIIEERMMKKKSNSKDSKTSTPAKKFKINSENLRERTKTKEDFNIRAKPKANRKK